MPWIISGGWKNNENAANGEISNLIMSTLPGTLLAPSQTATSDSIIPAARNEVGHNPSLLTKRINPTVSGSRDQAIGNSILGPTPGASNSSHSIGYLTPNLAQINDYSKSLIEWIGER